MFKRRRYKTRQFKKEEEIKEEINNSTDNVITKEPSETLSPSDFLPPINKPLPPINTRNKPFPSPLPKRKSSIESSINEIIENNNLLEKNEKTKEKEKKSKGIFGLSLFGRNKQKNIEAPEDIKQNNTLDDNNLDDNNLDNNNPDNTNPDKNSVDNKNEEKINNDLKNLKINNDNNQQLLTDILDNDEKLLFSLNALGSLQKDEKLTEKDNLLTVDDRWLFQGLRRWWSEDSRKKSSNKTLIVISTVTERINKLLEEDYLDKIKEENKPKTRNDRLETPDEKKFKENRDKRRRLINKYFVSLNKAKTGIENSRDTYDDNFTKNIFNLSIQKVEDTLENLQEFSKC